MLRRLLVSLSSAYALVELERGSGVGVLWSARAIEVWDERVEVHP